MTGCKIGLEPRQKIETGVGLFGDYSRRGREILHLQLLFIVGGSALVRITVSDDQRRVFGAQKTRAERGWTQKTIRGDADKIR